MTDKRKEKLIDLSGKRFNRLTVLYRDRKKYKGEPVYWVCQCDCGNTIRAQGHNIRIGRTQSCGCYRAEKLPIGNTRHGMCGTRIYQIWQSMIKRCTNRNNKDYQYYGGRGIEVCESWRIFENFYNDMGSPEKGFSLDRIDVNGNYEKSNCKWASNIDQANNKRNSHYLEYNGRKQTISQWARELGVNINSLYYRAKNGWPIKQIIEGKSNGS